jgi:hypothetical protein
MLWHERYLTALLGAAFAMIFEAALTQSARLASDTIGVVGTVVYFSVLGFLLGLALEAQRAPSSMSRAAPPPNGSVGRAAGQWQG